MSQLSEYVPLTRFCSICARVDADTKLFAGSVRSNCWRL